MRIQLGERERLQIHSSHLPLSLRLLCSFHSLLINNSWRRELVSIYASVQIILTFLSFVTWMWLLCVTRSNMRQSLPILTTPLFLLPFLNVLCFVSRSGNKFSIPILFESRTNVNVLRCNWWRILLHFILYSIPSFEIAIPPWKERLEIQRKSSENVVKLIYWSTANVNEHRVLFRPLYRRSMTNTK